MKIPDDLNITLFSKEITSSKSAKNLGVTMDCNLTYDEHVTQLTSKCIRSLCQINRVKYLFDRRTRTLITIILNSLVFSKSLYCSSVWANTTKKNIELLQTVQNFAARIVSGTRKFDHVTPILKQLQWLPIIEQLTVRDATMVFKCLNGLAPPYLCQKFKTRSKCTTATLGIGTAYIYHSVGRLQVSARLPSEAKSCGIVWQTSFDLSLI